MLPNYSFVFSFFFSNITYFQALLFDLAKVPFQYLAQLVINITSVIFLIVCYLSPTIFTVGYVPLLGNCLTIKIAAVIIYLEMRKNCISFTSTCYLIYLSVNSSLLKLSQPIPQDSAEPLRYRHSSSTMIWFSGLSY